MAQRFQGKELEASQQTIRFFESVLQASVDGMLATDVAQNIVLVNQTFCEIFDCVWREMIETNLYVWLGRIDRDTPRRWANLEHHVSSNKICSGFEFQIDTKDEIQHFSVNASLVELAGDEKNEVILSIWHDITNHRQLEEQLARHADRLEQRTVQLAKTTEQLNQEITTRVRMQDELLKVEKLESIGILAGGIAHDLNNFLTGLVGNIALANMTDDPVERAERLEHAEDDAMRIKDLTQQLLTFSKGGAPVTVVSDLGDLLKETVNFTLSGSDISCDCALTNDTYPVEIDEGQIRQVISNLIINGQQAMPEGGTVRVSAENVELNKDKSSIPLDAGPTVRFSVEDKGVGIPEEDRKRVFDPFFSTKPAGNGLGLATSYSIISKHEGLIAVESEVGVGSRFDVYLPASTEEVLEPKEAAAEAADSVPSDNRILVMDDQKSIRDVVVKSLSKLGCAVVTCANGKEVIEKYKDAMESGDLFNAVILDLTIPGGMGGSEAVKKLKELDPGVKARVASGYSDDPIITDYRDYGFKGGYLQALQDKELEGGTARSAQRELNHLV